MLHWYENLVNFYDHKWLEEAADLLNIDSWNFVELNKRVPHPAKPRIDLFIEWYGRSKEDILVTWLPRDWDLHCERLKHGNYRPVYATRAAEACDFKLREWGAMQSVVGESIATTAHHELTRIYGASRLLYKPESKQDAIARGDAIEAIDEFLRHMKAFLQKVLDVRIKSDFIVDSREYIDDPDVRVPRYPRAIAFRVVDVIDDWFQKFSDRYKLSVTEFVAAVRDNDGYDLVSRRLKRAGFDRMTPKTVEVLDRQLAEFKTWPQFDRYTDVVTPPPPKVPGEVVQFKPR